ncbi:hypothetical protein ACFQES_10420 [Nonomuraea salmonea]|uniref:hypothetical protein n=1 Tax=Nonomuraea salmonea TaxID=46181 RepID=UPI00361C7B33
MASRPHATVPSSSASASASLEACASASLEASLGAAGRAAWSSGVFSSMGWTSATCGDAWISATCPTEATSSASFCVPPLTSTALTSG